MLTMTNAHAFPGQSLASAHEASVGRVFDRSREAWAQYRAYRRTLAALRALPIDTLLDLDLYRGDLKAIARDQVRGPLDAPRAAAPIQ
jgi:uncharacterized protein YjiS (DUF1127 family)